MIGSETGAGGSPASGQAMAGTAKEKAGEISSAVTGQAAQIASTAADQARRVTGEASEQVRDLLGVAKDSASRQGEAQTQQVAATLGQLRDQAAALIDGRPQDAGPLVEHGRTVVDRLDEVVRRLETGGLQGAVQDAQRFARRRPVVFLVGAGLLGFAAGRAVKAGRDASSDGSAAPGSAAAGATGTFDAPVGWPREQSPSRAVSTPRLVTDDGPTLPVPVAQHGGSVPPPPPAPSFMPEQMER